MEIRGSEKLQNYMREHKYAKESYTRGLDSLNGDYNHDFAIYQSKKKNYKWGGYVAISILIGYAVWSAISEFILEAFLTFLGVGIVLLVIIYIFWLRDYKRYKILRLEYDAKKASLDLGWQNAIEYLHLAAKQVPEVIALSVYQEELRVKDEQNDAEPLQQYLLLKIEEVKKEMEIALGTNASDDQIIQYYNDWANQFTNNKEERDFRKEKLAYLKRKTEENNNI